MKSIFSIGIAIAAITTSISGCGYHNYPAWTASSSAAAELGPSQQIGSYQFNIPKNAVLFGKTTEVGDIEYSYDCPHRPARQSAWFNLSVFPDEGKGKEGWLKWWLASKASQYQQWRYQPIEHGLINGHEFVRAYWSGVEKSKPIHGVTYFTTNDRDRTSIAILARDYDQYYQQTLPVIEGAIMSAQEN